MSKIRKPNIRARLIVDTAAYQRFGLMGGTIGPIIDIDEETEEDKEAE